MSNTPSFFAPMTDYEIDLTSGGNTWNDISDAMFAASIVGAGAGAIPTPASPMLFGFSALTGLMGVGANYLSRY